MPYKILSLDGGGSWALIQARVIQDIYGDIPGHEILRNFDMVIANSGGSLVLAALVSDLKPGQILEIFLNSEDRKKVFSKLKFGEAPAAALLRHFGIGPRYKASRKKEGLYNVLKKHTGSENLLVSQPMSLIPSIIGGGCPDLVVCGFNYYTERAVFFRSNTSSNTDSFSGKYYDISLLDAIHASSNAPLNYFDEPAGIVTGFKNQPLRFPGWFWDGAVGGFNNPVLAGLVEAMTNGNGKNAEDYRILSLGTAVGRKPVIVGYDRGSADQQLIFEANKHNDLVENTPQKGFKNDLSKMAESILADPPDAASFVAFSILQPDLSNTNRIVRINPCINPEKKGFEYRVPEAWGTGAGDKASFKKLLELDMDAVEDRDVHLIMELCDKFIINDPSKPAIPNQFIRGDEQSPRYLGFGTYYEAKRQWLNSLQV